MSTLPSEIFTRGCYGPYDPLVKHAGPDALDNLDSLLGEIRSVPGLVEKSRGVFYRKSKAFLHFHEDVTGLHADVRRGVEFDRYRVETPDERDALLALIRSTVD